MTPVPPSSSPGDSPLPPRHRPTQEQLLRETSEDDLWDLDAADEPPAAAEADEPKLEEPAEEEHEPAAPAPLEDEPPVEEAPAESPPVLAPEPRGLSRRSGVKKTGKSPETDPPAPLPKNDIDREFGDLDEWDEPEPAAPAESAPAPTPAAAEPAEAPTGAEAAKPADAELPEAAPSADDDEFSIPKRDQPAKPVTLRAIGLSKLERIGLIGLALVLLAGGLFVLSQTIGRLPKADSGSSADFPVRGGHVRIDAADTAWREPVTGGAEADRVRRGTVLIPVVDLEIGEGTGAIRVFFRDENGTAVGDAISRPVRGAGTLSFAATAGFDNLGLYAAYRTDRTEPWTVEVYEGPGADRPLEEFTKLFVMPVSARRR